jgi:glucose-6-phosphate dehydrogenase assembly protein OpcA
MAKPLTTLLTRPSSPESIEDDLAILWRDAAREGPVARAVMANLVVYRDRPDRGRVDLAAPVEGVPIDEVALRCPARVIMLHHTAQSTPCGPIGAMIRILLFGPPGMRIGVEQIAVRSTCAEDSLPSIVRHLLLGDIPTTVWWAEDLSHVAPLDALVTMGRQLLYDSRQWRDIRRGMHTLARLLSRAHAPDLADLNWRRLTPMRQALVQALAPAAGGATNDALPVHVRYRPGDAALGWLLVGWFSSRLRWRTDAGWPVTIEEAPQDDEMLSVSLGSHLTARMNGHRVLVKFTTGSAPFSIAVPRDTAADTIASELRTSAHDNCLREAVIALAERFASQGSP